MAKKKSFLTELAVEAALLGLNIASKLGKLNSSFSHGKNSFKFLFARQNIWKSPWEIQNSQFHVFLAISHVIQNWLIKFKLITYVHCK